MYKLSKTMCVAVCAFGSAVGPISAATLEVDSGTASVNRGQGFQRAGSGANLNTGDRVMVSPGGNARIVYENGCATPFSEGAVRTVTTPSQCAEVVGTTTGVSPATIAVGVGAAAAVGAAIYFATKDNKTSP